MKMNNLLCETNLMLQAAGLDWRDVKSIQVRNRRISVERFKELANREYDSGYGTRMVDGSLVILLNDGRWMERDEYDGSEWWRLVSPPQVIESLSDSSISTLFDETCMDDSNGWTGLGPDKSFRKTV